METNEIKLDTLVRILETNEPIYAKATFPKNIFENGKNNTNK